VIGDLRFEVIGNQQFGNQFSRLSAGRLKRRAILQELQRALGMRVTRALGIPKSPLADLTWQDTEGA
jgi:hypothetical protein